MAEAEPCGWFWGVSEATFTRYLPTLIDHHRAFCLGAAKRSVGTQELREREGEGNGYDICPPTSLTSLRDWSRDLMMEMIELEAGGVSFFWWKALGTGWPVIAHVSVGNEWTTSMKSSEWLKLVVGYFSHIKSPDWRLPVLAEELNKALQDIDSILVLHPNFCSLLTLSSLVYCLMVTRWLYRSKYDISVQGRQNGKEQHKSIPCTRYFSFLQGFPVIPLCLIGQNLVTWSLLSAKEDGKSGF